MAVSEASTVRVVSAFFPGWLSKAAFDNAIFAASNARSQSGDHSIDFPFLFPTALCSGISFSAM